MCGQCVAGAAAATTAATGVRAWLAARGYTWMTPRRLRGLSVGLVASGIVAASVRF